MEESVIDRKKTVNKYDEGQEADWPDDPPPPTEIEQIIGDRNDDKNEYNDE